MERKRWEKIKTMSGVDAIAPWSTPSSRVAGHNCQEDRAGGSVSCELWSPFFTLHQIVFDLLDQLRILKIRRKSKVPLEAVPYSEEYKDHLSKSADFLKEVKQFSALRLVLILIFSFIIMCSLLSRFSLLHFMCPSPGCGQDGQPFAGQVSQSASSGTFSSLIDCLDGFFACFLSLSGFSQVCNWCSPPTTKAFMDNEYGESDRLWLDVDSRLSWSSSISPAVCTSLTFEQPRLFNSDS